MRDPIDTLRSFGRRRVTAAVVLAAALALAPIALASDRYSDVTDANQFHENINNIAAAGITFGCGAGIYCPKDFVTREQMAAFLNRVGGRAAVATFANPLGTTPGAQPANNAVLDSTTITVIGYQMLDLRAHFFTFTYAGSGTFACEIAYRFRINGSIVGSATMFDRFNAAPPNTWETRVVNGEHTVVVAPGTYTVSLTYQRVTNTCSSYPGSGLLIVEAIPFGGSGDAVGGLSAPAGSDLPGLEGIPTTQSNGDPIE